MPHALRQYGVERQVRADLGGLVLSTDGATTKVDGVCRSRWAFVVMRSGRVYEKLSGNAPSWINSSGLGELWAVARGVWWMVEHGIGTDQPINILSDSQEVVRLLNNPQHGSRHRKAIMACAIAELCQAFGTTRIVWVPRKQNREADDLASLRPGRDTKNARKNRRRRAKLKQELKQAYKVRSQPLVTYSRSRMTTP